MAERRGRRGGEKKKNEEKSGKGKGLGCMLCGHYGDCMKNNNDDNPGALAFLQCRLKKGRNCTTLHVSYEQYENDNAQHKTVVITTRHNIHSRSIGSNGTIILFDVLICLLA